VRVRGGSECVCDERLVCVSVFVCVSKCVRVGSECV